MSEENNVTQTPEDTQANNNSTQAEDKNVPYDRFAEVNAAKNDALSQIGKLQAQIDKMNQTTKDKEQAKLVEDGKLKEALGIVTKERDNFKTQAEQWNQYQSNKRETLMNQLTDDTDKSIADGLSLEKLEQYVTKVSNVSAPSTSKARATTGSAGEFGGYSSYAEWASKDPKGYQQSRNMTNSGVKIAYSGNE
tara:strand:- start:2651 stop:3229 length:579 start_codon:yes stop_codon:yes gene_type:complete